MITVDPMQPGVLNPRNLKNAACRYLKKLVAVTIIRAMLNLRKCGLVRSKSRTWIGAPVQNGGPRGTSLDPVRTWSKPVNQILNFLCDYKFHWDDHVKIRQTYCKNWRKHSNIFPYLRRKMPRTPLSIAAFRLKVECGPTKLHCCDLFMSQCLN